MAAISREGEALDPVRPQARHILTAAMPHLNPLDRVLLRIIALAGRSRISSISGAGHIAADRDPFILALNHNTRLEALFVPALLVLLRNGRRIHFLADWNFRMIPGVDLIYRRSGAITVPNKSARPRVLNVLKPLFTDRVPPMVRARELLLSGSSVGIFPEGTINRHPTLLRGRLGAAHLSIETGVPVVPAGLRFSAVTPGAPLAEGSPVDIVVGEALQPPPATVLGSIETVRHWHAQIMASIGALSGKSPKLQGEEKPNEDVRADQKQTRSYRN